MGLAAQQPTRISNNFNVFEVQGNITQSGSYAPGGDTLDLSGLGVPSNSVPDSVTIDEEPPTGTVASGYTFRYARGSGQNNGKVQAFSSGGNELGAVTYASVNIANLRYTARFLKFQ